MKSPITISRTTSLVAWIGLVLLLAAPTGNAADAKWATWPFEHPITLTQTGWVRLTVPLNGFSASREDGGDWRILSPSGEEVPYLVEHGTPERHDLRRINRPPVTLGRQETEVTVPLDRPSFLRAIHLETPDGSFLKAASVQWVLKDGTLRPAVRRRAIFRLNGVENLTIPLAGMASETNVSGLRLTLEDVSSAPIPLTAITLEESEAGSPSPVPQPAAARILERLEGSGETRLTLGLEEAGLPWVGLRLEVEDPLFIRRVTVLHREWIQGELRDKALGSGNIHRVDLGQGNSAAELEIRFPKAAGGRELIVAVQNGDSPPLKIRSAVLLYQPVNLLFLAKEQGSYRLLSGATEERAPVYDITALSRQLQGWKAIEGAVGTRVARPDYQQPAALANVQIFGGVFDPAGWRFHRSVTISESGVQSLEVPVHGLANTRPDHGDIRLVSGGRQILYLLDDPGFSKPIDLRWRLGSQGKSNSDSPEGTRARPGVSRWELELPLPQIPATRLRCVVASKLFDREMRLLERRSSPGMPPEDRVLGRARWTRTPERASDLFDLPVDSTPTTQQIWLETNDGDNAPLELRSVQWWVPSVRLIFQAPDNGPVELYYGHAEVSRPRYDLELIAPQVLKALKQEARCNENDIVSSVTPATPWRATPWMIYPALMLVVAGLLWVITRLLPASNPDSSAKGK